MVRYIKFFLLNVIILQNVISETTKAIPKFNYPVQAIYLIINPNEKDGISWGATYEDACKKMGAEYFWGIVLTTRKTPACYRLSSYNLILGTDSYFCADGSIDYFNIPAHFCPEILTCPGGNWTLSSDKTTCNRDDLPCNPDPKNVSEEQLLAAIAYGESHWSNVYEEMAAIASATVRKKEVKGYNTVNELILSDKNFAYAASKNTRNERYYNIMCSNNSPGIDLAYKAAQNALNNGYDYSNGACFWDGLDLKTKGKNAYRYSTGFKISNEAHNVFSVIEPPPLHEEGSNGKFYDYIYISTAGHGKSIFWKISKEYLAATGGKQCV